MTFPTLESNQVILLLDAGVYPTHSKRIAPPLGVEPSPSLLESDVLPKHLGDIISVFCYIFYYILLFFYLQLYFFAALFGCRFYHSVQIAVPLVGFEPTVSSVRGKRDNHYSIRAWKLGVSNP